VPQRQQLHDHGETARRRLERGDTLRLRELGAGLLAEAEAARTAPLDTAAEAFRRDAGVPLAAAVAEHVQAAQVDHLFETELVAQHAASVVPVAGLELQPDFAARRGDSDAGFAEACAQAFGEHRRRFHQRGTPARAGPGATASSPNTLARRIFFCSCRIPYTSASAVGGQPGTYTSTGTMRSQPRTTE